MPAVPQAPKMFDPPPPPPRGGGDQKKDLDPDPMMSPGHDDPPMALTLRRAGRRRLHPTEIYETLVAEGLTTPH